MLRVLHNVGNIPVPSHMFFVPLKPLLLLSVVAFLRNFLRLVWACNFWPDAYVVYFLEPGPISALEPGLQLGVGVLAVDASSIHLDTLDGSVLQERTLVFDILATAIFHIFKAVILVFEFDQPIIVGDSFSSRRKNSQSNGSRKPNFNFPL